jgi:hypothetical protein
MSDSETKAELRQIEKEIERQESIDVLKAKHGITGTREQQKEKLEEKKIEISNENAILENEI